MRGLILKALMMWNEQVCIPHFLLYKFSFSVCFGSILGGFFGQDSCLIPPFHIER